MEVIAKEKLQTLKLFYRKITEKENSFAVIFT